MGERGKCEGGGERGKCEGVGERGKCEGGGSTVDQLCVNIITSFLYLL